MRFALSMPDEAAARAARARVRAGEHVDGRDDHRRGLGKSEGAHRQEHEGLVQVPARDYRDAGRGLGGGQSRCRLEEPAREDSGPGDALGVRGDGYR